MIIGIGVDTVNIERFERIVTETPAFVRRVFTPNERTRNIRSQAVRFAAKEAVAKVLGAPAELACGTNPSERLGVNIFPAGHESTVEHFFPTLR